jgi:hypothetical protein
MLGSTHNSICSGATKIEPRIRENDTFMFYRMYVYMYVFIRYLNLAASMCTTVHVTYAVTVWATKMQRILTY